MIGITIHKASPVGIQEIPDVTITIAGECPGFESLNEAATFYDQQAEELLAALRGSLPGGTLDRLLAKMLIQKSSHFVIPSWDTGEGEGE